MGNGPPPATDPSATATGWPFHVPRIAYLLLFLTNCWIWMQGVHEFGHAVAAVLTGGHVTCIVWHLSEISRTDVLPNPRPLLVCWAGPVLGCLLPAVAAGCVSQSGRTGRSLRFFAGFCLIANGLYLAAGSFDRVGDAGDLLKLGSSIYLLWAAGLAATVIGLIIWHRLGRVARIRSMHVTRRQLAIQTAILLVSLLLQQAVMSLSP
ncbi:MAG: M50 family metallopeptidase [Fuerstiella sp.]